MNEIATAKKKLNPNQAKFVKLLTAGGMSRAQAYSKAYGQKNLVTARITAYQLIATNPNVKAEIDRILEEGLAAARERLSSEADNTVDKLLFLRDGGNKEYTVQLGACKDILDRIGMKPKEQVEHSGEVGVNWSNNNNCNNVSNVW
jgi:hypothetical protein